MLRLFKIFIAVIFINKSINICLAEPPDIYLNNVDFVVGIFEANSVNSGRLTYLNQGVLISKRLVLTTSVYVLWKNNLKVRTYAWRKKPGTRNDHKAEKSLYIQHNVEENEIFPEMTKISYLILEKNHNDDIKYINYVNYNGGGLLSPGNRCALVKLKWNNGIRELNSQIKVKQRHIQSPFYYLEKGCPNTFFELKKKYLSDTEYFFCIEETGKKNCNPYPGAALVCEAYEQIGYYYLAGIEIMRNNCHLMFADTQVLQNSIETLIKLLS
ncbi:uncharacterized protein LOC128668970 [Microplitis demolitor]|uniref:uncharacterized protein LOC128668970 n=1 Tax=Microplitis demolitor TaxID=69319 RepID=UPI00235B70AC|nr:uncharacterized protein LOC128668970 [Microplitis demolitor]